MAAVVALAAVAGAIGGALGDRGHRTSSASNDTASVRNVGLEASVARLDADILALKASAEQNARVATGQLNKTSDRLDKVEKAQDEPHAKARKIERSRRKDPQGASRSSRAQPRLPLPRLPAMPVAAAAPAAPKEVTGSISPPATRSRIGCCAAPASAKTEIARLPTVEGWVLRDVGRGGNGALIESRRGVYEVYPGEPVPGLGRVDAIRKQDGRWVVVTSKGLIVSR